MKEHNWKKIGSTVANVSVWKCPDCKRQEVNVFGRLPFQGCCKKED